jgi:hypothetical protein
MRSMLLPLLTTSPQHFPEFQAKPKSRKALNSPIGENPNVYLLHTPPAPVSYAIRWRVNVNDWLCAGIH